MATEEVTISISGVDGLKGREELLGVTVTLQEIGRSWIQNIRVCRRCREEFLRIPVDVYSLNQLLRKDFRQLMQQSGCLKEVGSDG
jgi:hypothetical protein